MLPSITTVNFPAGVSAEVYLDGSSAGPNVVHLFLTTPSATPATAVSVIATDGTRHVALRQGSLGQGHYVEVGSFPAGAWQFHVGFTVGARHDRTIVERTLS